MKRIILICLVMLLEQSLVFGATDCTVVQYPDRTEVVCIGDRAVQPDSKAFAAGVTSAGAVQIDGKGTYSTVQDAYDAATDSDVIHITGVTTPGPLLANNQSLGVVTFTGGCDSSFLHVPGETTTILGTVIVNSGKIIMNAIKVKPGAAVGPAPVNLGTAGNFVILTKTGVSTTGTTAVTGNIGASPVAASYLTGFDLIADATNTFATSSLVAGKLYAADHAVPTPAMLTTAVSDMQTAFTDAAGRTLPDFIELGTGNVSGMTLVPGLYKWSSGVLITSAGVTLSGGADDVWIFQIAQDLIVNNSAIITLSGGAQAKNVFWQVSGQATLGTLTDFKGIILSQTLISLNTGAKMTGRALAQTAVTLNATAINVP